MPDELPFHRRTWMTLEPMHGMVYFTPFGAPIYDEIGLRGRAHYFAPRVAPLGRATAEITTSTFYNFSPAIVSTVIPDAWDAASPETVLNARYRVVDAALRSVGEALIGTEGLAHAAALARKAALRACEHLEGRPLFAAHAALQWPTEDHLVLWHAQTLLREFRGDGHIAVLVAEGLSGLEALITHAATGAVPAETLRTLRGWTEEEWATGLERLSARGIVTVAADGSFAFTSDGQRLRESIEHRTDALAAAPYEFIGESACQELRNSARPLSQAVVDAGWSPMRRLPEPES